MINSLKSKQKGTEVLQQQQQQQQDPKQKHSVAVIAPTKSRRVEIDGRTFYELHPGGRFTGYCLMCAHESHTDSSGKFAGSPCCKSVTFGGKRPFSPQEARQRLLCWEAAGTALTGATPRSDHVQMGGQLLAWYAS